jgi:hypothetical protein
VVGGQSAGRDLPNISYGILYFSRQIISTVLFKWGEYRLYFQWQDQSVGGVNMGPGLAEDRRIFLLRSRRGRLLLFIYKQGLVDRIKVL